MPPVHFETIKAVVLARDRTKTTVCYGIHRRVRQSHAYPDTSRWCLLMCDKEVVEV